MVELRTICKNALGLVLHPSKDWEPTVEHDMATWLAHLGLAIIRSNELQKSVRQRSNTFYNISEALCSRLGSNRWFRLNGTYCWCHKAFRSVHSRGLRGCFWWPIGRQGNVVGLMLINGYVCTSEKWTAAILEPHRVAPSPLQTVLEGSSSKRESYGFCLKKEMNELYTPNSGD